MIGDEGPPLCTAQRYGPPLWRYDLESNPITVDESYHMRLIESNMADDFDLLVDMINDCLPLSSQLTPVSLLNGQRRPEQ